MDRTKRFRPAPGGVSIGNVLVTAGTLGCLVYKKGQPFILSNNHVLAAVNKAEIGSPIVQPGVADGGTVENDELGKLYEFIPISLSEVSGCSFANAITSIMNCFARLFGRKTRLKAYIPGKPNTVDCAIASPNQEEDVLDRILEDESTLIKIEGEAEPEVGLAVKKNGRTTGTTRAVIAQVDAAVNVGMGEGRMALFADQFIVEKEGMCAGGDSGSLVLTENNKAVGLLFAGSDQTMVANRFSNIKKELGIELG